jgi:hypothetical protein
MLSSQTSGQAMFFSYRRVRSISVVPALVTVASVAIVVGVAAIVLFVVGVVACSAVLLRAIGVIRPGKSAVPVQDHATIEGVVVRSSECPVRSGLRG